MREMLAGNCYMRLLNRRRRCLRVPSLDLLREQNSLPAGGTLSPFCLGLRGCARFLGEEADTIPLPAAKGNISRVTPRAVGSLVQRRGQQGSTS